MNPIVVSRSGLYAQPYVDAATGWKHSLSFDYGSAAEWEESSYSETYVLDAELMRVQLGVRKDIAPDRFIQLTMDLNGAFNGFADAAFDWYHSTIGIGFRGRDSRPMNEFKYTLPLPNGRLMQRVRPDYYLGDLRVGYGVRHTARHQSTFSLTLPTSTAPDGYSKNSFSLAAIHTFRSALSERWSFEGTFGAGFTPAQGDLASIQNKAFVSASAGINARVYKRHVMYGYLYTHSPHYHTTRFRELVNRETTADFGWMMRTNEGRVWRIGLAEDLGPMDNGIDLTLKIGVSW